MRTFEEILRLLLGGTARSFSAEMRDLIERRIGEIARGAMGVVYRARDPLIDRLVAIKTVNIGASNAESDAYERRFAADGDEGRLVTTFRSETSWSRWERHPAGEEVVVLLSGRIDLVQRTGDGERGEGLARAAA